MRDDRFNFEERDPRKFGYVKGEDGNINFTDWPVMIKDAEGNDEIMTCTIPSFVFDKLVEDEAHTIIYAMDKLGTSQDYFVNLIDKLRKLMEDKGKDECM